MGEGACLEWKWQLRRTIKSRKNPRQHDFSALTIGPRPAGTRLARHRNASAIKVIWAVQIAFKKFPAFIIRQISCLCRASRSGRGALAIVTNVGTGCGGRDSVVARLWRVDERRGRGRRSRVVLTPRRWRQVLAKLRFSASDGDKKARSPGRVTKETVKPLRRECRARSGEPVVTTSCIFCTKPWVHRAPGIPCALYSFGANEFAKLGRIVSREREAISFRRPWGRSAARGVGLRPYTGCHIFARNFGALTPFMHSRKRLSRCDARTLAFAGTTRCRSRSSPKDYDPVNPLETIMGDQWADPPAQGNAHALP